MERFKHNAGKTCHKLQVQQNCQQPEFCPVQALWHYCKLRGNFAEPLFCFLNGTPGSRSFFSQKLKLSLQFAGCNTAMYKAHSFRIGAATHASIFKSWVDGIQMHLKNILEFLYYRYKI